MTIISKASTMKFKTINLNAAVNTNFNQFMKMSIILNYTLDCYSTIYEFRFSVTKISNSSAQTFLTLQCICVLRNICTKS